MPNNFAGATIEIGYKYRILEPTGATDRPFPTFIAEEHIGVIRPVAHIHARRGHHVIWTIINYTSNALEVSVDAFNPPAPIRFIAGKSLTINGNGASQQIQCDVDTNAQPGVHTYQIFINNNLALDPELDIET